MTASPRSSRAAVRDDLPPALSSMWRLCKLGYRHEPGLLLAAFFLALIAALPDALLAYWFKLLGEGVLQSDPGRLIARHRRAERRRQNHVGQVAVPAV